MRYTTKNKRTLAILLSAVMATSVFAMGFMGAAAADVNDINSLDAESDLIVGGEDTVEQTIKLEKVQFDGEETIEISDQGDTIQEDQIDSIESNASSPHGEDEFTTGTVDEVEIDRNTIEITHDAQESLDLEIVVNLNLEDVVVDGEDEDVTYEAIAQEGNGDVTNTFQLFPPQPEFDGAEATAETPTDFGVDGQIEIEFTEDVQVHDEGDLINALSLDDGELEQDVSISTVEDVSDDTITIGLDGYFESGDTDTLEDALDYDGDSNDNPIRHGDNIEVTADDFSDEDVANNAAPSFDSATVVSGETDEIAVTFSEDVDPADGEEAVGQEFDLESYGINDDETDVTDNIVTLNITGDDVAADDDTTEEILASTDLSGVLVAADGDEEPAVDFDQDKDIENTVAPEIDSAEVTAEDPNWLEITFDSNVKVDEENVDSSTFNFGAEDADVEEFGFLDGDDTVVMVLDEEIESGADFEGEEGVEYTGDDEITSDAPFNPTQAAGEETVSNNVEPLFTSASVQAGGTEILVEFSEDVEEHDVNLDDYATAQFELENPDHKIHQGEIDNGDVVLNLAEDDGSDLFVGEDDEPVLTHDADGGLVSAVDSETDAAGFSDKPVFNNQLIDSAVATYDPDATPGGNYSVEIAFTVDIEQDGTESQVANAFSIGANEAEIDDEDGDFETIVTVDEDANTVTFEGVEAEGEDLHSGIDLTGEDGLEYDDSDEVLRIVGDDPIDSFGTSIENNIVPVIDEESLSVMNTEPGELEVLFSEDIAKVDGVETETVADAFDLEGVEFNDASFSSDTITLEFDEIDSETTLGALTYDAETFVVESAEDESEAFAEGGPLAPVNVENHVGDDPVLTDVIVDDIEANNELDTEGEMQLVFSGEVSVSDGPVSTDGLEFETNSNENDVNLVDSSLDDTDEDNILTVGYESASTSNTSNIDQGESLSDAVFTIGEGNDIEADAEGAEVVEEEYSGVASNEIAGDIETAESVEINQEILATIDEGDYTEDLSVAVDGPLQDDAGNDIIYTGGLTVDIVDDDEETIASIPVDSVERFDTGDVTVSGEIDTTSVSAFDQVVGEEITAQLADAESEPADVVHEAYEAPVEGSFITSQPMPGELVIESHDEEAGTGISGVQQWDANASDFENYADGDAVDNVHKGLFIHAEDSDAVYGYVFDEDPDGIGANTAEMSEGWNVVSSNFNINEQDDVQFDTDLAFSSSPAAESDDVRLWKLNDDGTTVSMSADYHNDVEKFDAYYVFMHESNERPIIEPGYNVTDPRNGGGE